MRKQPRDFVHVDEFWDADKHWQSYFIAQQLWIYVDEYRAELTGDQDYSRIIVHSAPERGWVFKRQLSEKTIVESVLGEIVVPVSELQLEKLGFVQWRGTCINA